MTKNNLIKELQKIKGNPNIVLSSDPEGNSFSTLYQVDGEINFFDEENREFMDTEDMDERDYDRYVKSIVLWPS